MVITMEADRLITVLAGLSMTVKVAPRTIQVQISVINKGKNQTAGLLLDQTCFLIQLLAGESGGTQESGSASNSCKEDIPIR